MTDNDATVGYGGTRPGSTRFEVGDQVAGFRLDAVLGAGGQGTVYKAWDVTAKRTVALKMLHETHDSDREPLLNEVRKAASVEHENVVRVLYVTPESQTPFFLVTEYVDGAPLDEVIRGEAPLPEKAVLRIVRDIARALACAHSGGIVHLDVKPANVLLDRATGRAKVSDFGMAIHHRERWSRGLGGTLYYMSPEQITGQTVQLDGRADIWSVGVIMYEMLTGQRPFGVAPTSTDRLRREITDVHPKPPSQWNPVVSGTADAILLKCLEKDVSARYRSAAQLLEDVETRLQGLPEPLDVGLVEPDHSQSNLAQRRGPIVAVGGCLIAVAAAACALLVAVGAIDGDDLRRFLQRLIKAVF